MVKSGGRTFLTNCIFLSSQEKVEIENLSMNSLPSQFETADSMNIRRNAHIKLNRICNNNVVPLVLFLVLLIQTTAYARPNLDSNLIENGDKISVSTYSLNCSQSISIIRFVSLCQLQSSPSIPKFNLPLPSNDHNPSKSSSKTSDASTASVHGDETHRYPLATVDFRRVETPFIIGVWILFASIAKIGFHMTPRINKVLPESSLLIVVGVGKSS